MPIFPNSKYDNNKTWIYTADGRPMWDPEARPPIISGSIPTIETKQEFLERQFGGGWLAKIWVRFLMKSTE